MDNSLDVTFTSDTNGVAGSFRLISAPDDDPILLDGNVSSLDGKQAIGLGIEISQSDLNSSNLQQLSDTTYAFMDEDGATPSDYGVQNFASMDRGDGKSSVFTGTFGDPKNGAYEFNAMTDPAAGAVIIAIVAIGASACLLAIGISALTTSCTSATTADVQACADQGGLPSVKAHVIYGFSYQTGKFQIGCTHECQVECMT